MKYRHALIAGLALAVACGEEPVGSAGPVETPRANVVVQSIDTLPSGAVTNTVMAQAISPRGWVLGNLLGRTQSWSPYPDYVARPVTDPGTVWSGADEHGDLTAWISGRGPVVYFADGITGGHPYAVVSLSMPPNAGDTLHWGARDLSGHHLVVGYETRSDGLAHLVAWVPTAQNATSWFPPISLPLPNYSLGVSSSGTAAEGVNAAGLVVGTVVESQARGGGIYRAWHWRVQEVSGAWTATSLGPLPWASGSKAQAAKDVNDAGVIFGWVGEPGKEYAALWFPDATGNYTQPPRVRAVATWNTTHINRCGWAVSTMMSGKGRDGGTVAWNGTTAIALPKLPGSSESKSFDINDDGLVAGASVFTGKGSTSTRHVATVWRGFVPPCP